jgi:beta-galactosidase/beta-glucuronidase
MGNSLGDIVDYWNVFYKYDRVTGGYIVDIHYNIYVYTFIFCLR